MKIRNFITFVDNVYIAQIFTEGFTENQKNKMASHSEPEVDAGGNFAGSLTRPGDGSPTVLDFDLPADLRRISTDFPVKQAFDIRDDADSDVKAELWRLTMITRLTAARAVLLALEEPYVGETLTDLN